MIFNPLFIDSDAKQINPVGFGKTNSSYLFRDIINVVQNSSSPRLFNSNAILTNILTDIKGLIKSPRDGGSKLDDELNTLLSELNIAGDFRSSQIHDLVTDSFIETSVISGTVEKISETITNAIKKLENNYNLEIEYPADSSNTTKSSNEIENLIPQIVALLKAEEPITFHIHQSVPDSPLSLIIEKIKPETVHISANEVNEVLYSVTLTHSKSSGLQNFTLDDISPNYKDPQPVFQKEFMEFFESKTSYGTGESVNKDSSYKDSQTVNKAETAGIKSMNNVLETFKITSIHEPGNNTSIHNTEVDGASEKTVTQSIKTGNLVQTKAGTIDSSFMKQDNTDKVQIDNKTAASIVKEDNKKTENVLEIKPQLNSPDKNERIIFQHHIAPEQSKENTSASGKNELNIDKNTHSVNTHDFDKTKQVLNNIKVTTTPELSSVDVEKSEIPLKTPAKNETTNFGVISNQSSVQTINEYDSEKNLNEIIIKISPKQQHIDETNDRIRQNFIEDIEKLNNVNLSNYTKLFNKITRTFNNIPALAYQSQNMKPDIDRIKNDPDKNLKPTDLLNDALKKSIDKFEKAIDIIEQTTGNEKSNLKNQAGNSYNKTIPDTVEMKSIKDVETSKSSTTEYPASDTIVTEKLVSKTSTVQNEQTNNGVENSIPVSQNNKAINPEQNQSSLPGTIHIRTKEMFQPELNKKLLDEISEMTISDKKNKAIINLEPASLGKIRIALEIIENKLNVRLEVESLSSKEMLQHQVDFLKESLNRNGLQLNSINISLQNSEQKPNKAAREKRKENNVEKLETNDKSGKEKTTKTLGYNTYEFIA